MNIEIKGWEKLQSLMTGEGRRILKPSIDENSEDFGRAIRNQIFDTEGPRKISMKPTRRDLHFGKIFKGYLEIASSVRTLKDIETYIACFPYRKKPITKPDHLRYHKENYFNEIYILKERLIAYLTTIGRCYRKEKRHKTILSLTRPVFKFVRESLANVIETRRGHVHIARYSDEDLDRLDLMELLVESSADEVSTALRQFYMHEYRRVRIKWKNQIIENNKQLRKLLDFYSIAITKAVFDKKTGKMIYPSNL